MSANGQTYKEIVALDALPLSQAIKQRQISCREVMQAYLVQIAQQNPAVNALVSLRPESELLDEADQCDRELAQGQYRGWLHGIPQAPKDLAACNGLVTSMGSPLFAQHITAHDAYALARMREAGAVFIGRTNVPEFGLGSHTYNRVFGITGNAYNPDLSAGGSSGGAAVALALRMLPVADGSDMMGSLRNPAAWNNVYGLRPSHGRVPAGPAPELFLQQLGTEGPMGRSVADVAALLRTQAGYTPHAPLSSRNTDDLHAKLERDFTGTRIGWLGDFNGYLPTEPGLMAVCASGLDQFRALGIEIETCQPDFAMERLWHCWLVHRQWLVTGLLAAAYSNRKTRTKLKPEAVWEVKHGLKLSAMDSWRASVERSNWYRALLKLFEHYDYLALPSAQVFPFDKNQTWPQHIAGRAMDTYHRWMEVVIGPTLAGLPTISVPIGFNQTGLPMGLQLIGKPHADLAVLQLAYAHEQHTHWVKHHLPPKLHVS